MIFAVVILSVVAWFAVRLKKPVHGGKNLGAWFREYKQSGDPAAANVIRQIGTDALPALLELARTKDSSLIDQEEVSENPYYLAI